ncbi:MAG TPA: cytochrome P450 [Candidatus Dormibacteraeota bacterium]
MALPPGPRLPAAAQAYLLAFHNIAFLDACRRRHGESFTLRLAGGHTLVCLSSPEAARDILSATPDQATAGDVNAHDLGAVLGANSLLLLDGDRHLEERRLMLPPFHGERLRDHAEVIAEVTRSSLRSWPVGAPFSIWERMREITLEVILRAVFGVEGGALAELRGTVAGLLGFAGRRLLIMPAFRRDLGPLSPWAGFVAARARVRETVLATIRERRATAGAQRRADILSMLLQARRPDGSALGDVEVYDELLTLLVAGHETTAAALAWTVDLLLHHPAVLERVTAELEDGGDALLDAVIREALRLRPVVPEIGRHLRAPRTVGGVELPRGVVAVLSIHQLQRRPETYPEPLAFRPDRFLGRRPDAHAWLPFGGGIRRCLGAAFATMEMRVVLRTVLTSVRLRAASPSLEPARRQVVTLVPRRHGVRVRLARAPAGAAAAAAGPPLRSDRAAP